MEEHNCVQSEEISGIKAAIVEMKEYLKKISDLLVGQATNAERLKEHDHILKDHEDRIRTVEKDTQHNTGKVTWMERFVWAVVTGLVGFIFYSLRG